MASVTERAGPGLRLPSVPLAFFGVLLLGPVLLGISRLLPEEGGGLWLRLAAASACVLFLPGALLLRAFDWPRRLGQVIAGSLAWSLVAVAVAFALTFAASGSLSLTIVVLGVVAAGGALAALRAAPARLDRRDLYPAAAVAVGGLALCGVVWWASTVVGGDALFHLARVRKLDEVPVLYSVHVVNEFRDGSLHPQYAFPLWDGVLALVGRLAGVDPSLAVLHLSAVLTPVALLMAYAAGAALFVSWAGGVAASIAAATLVGFQHDGIGAFETTALPASAAGLLIVPALLALVFGYVRGGPRSRIATIAAAAFGLAAVYPTFALFVALPLAGFLLGRFALARSDLDDRRRIAWCLAAVLVPLVLFFAWLWPIVLDTASFIPSAAERARDLAEAGGSITDRGGWLSFSPGAIAAGGAATVAALLCIPAAALAGRHRWAAYVLGGSLVVLAVLLVPPFFTAVAELTSPAQAGLLVLFLPLAFALVGAATVAARLRLVGCGGAAALGLGTALAFSSGTTGQAWVTWIAVAGAVAGLVAARFVGREAPDPGRFAVAVMVAFAIPIAVMGFRGTAQDPPDRFALTPGLVEALNSEVPMRSTVFSYPETALRIGASAPLYVNALPPARSANTEANIPYDRRDEAHSFFENEDLTYLDKARLLSDHGASWLVLDKTRPIPGYVEYLPAAVYEDERYALIPLRR